MILYWYRYQYITVDLGYPYDRTDIGPSTVVTRPRTWTLLQSSHQYSHQYTLLRVDMLAINWVATATNLRVPAVFPAVRPSMVDISDK